MKTAEERAREYDREWDVGVAGTVELMKLLEQHEADVRADEREACAQIADEYTRGVNGLRQRRQEVDRLEGRAVEAAKRGCSTALEGFAAEAAKMADRIGCMLSTQIGEMPRRSEMDWHLRKAAERVTQAATEDDRNKALADLAAQAVFARSLGGAR